MLMRRCLVRTCGVGALRHAIKERGKRVDKLTVGRRTLDAHAHKHQVSQYCVAHFSV